MNKFRAHTIARNMEEQCCEDRRGACSQNYSEIFPFLNTCRCFHLSSEIFHNLRAHEVCARKTLVAKMTLFLVVRSSFNHVYFFIFYYVYKLRNFCSNFN